MRKTSIRKTIDELEKKNQKSKPSWPEINVIKKIPAKRKNNGGVMARGFTVSVEDERYEIELQPGEVAMLDDKGNLVHFTDNGITINSKAKIEVTAKSDVTVNTPGNILQNGKNIKLNDGTGAITCESICPFMGKQHVDGSETVFIGKS